LLDTVGIHLQDLSEDGFQLFSVTPIRMTLEPGKYYHIYNRSNNREVVFKRTENYHYFIEKYEKLILPFVETISYCFIPTHFHFCIKVTTHDTDLLRKNVGVLLSSYTRAINKRYDRNGSLFQKHTKAIEVDDEAYILTLCMYIHQNPVRSRIVVKQEDWKFSSYGDYAEIQSSMPIQMEL
jgi:REP element-mobilizing transposase RayT